MEAQKNPLFEEGLPTGVARIVAHVGEEAGELAQAVGKQLRWGGLSRNPDIAESERNIEALLREAADVQAVVDTLMEHLPNTESWQEHYADCYGQKYARCHDLYKHD